MNKEKLFSLIGTIAQFMAMIALIPYQFGDIAMIFPPEVKVLVLKIAIVAYVIGRILSKIVAMKFDVPPPSWGGPESPAKPLSPGKKPASRPRHD